MNSELISPYMSTEILRWDIYEEHPGQIVKCVIPTRLPILD